MGDNNYRMLYCIQVFVVVIIIIVFLVIRMSSNDHRYNGLRFVNLKQESQESEEPSKSWYIIQPHATSDLLHKTLKPCI